MFQLGRYRFESPISLAPMAGVTDSTWRRICVLHGASYAVSEMLASDPRLRDTIKSKARLDFCQTPGIRIAQIAGADPDHLASAARYCVHKAADVIDINMGCPAKKVCKKMAGSALLRDEALVSRILHRVVAAVTVPVSLKIRTGWDIAHRNAVQIARIAEHAGICLITVHGRSRACRYDRAAEYDTIAAVKQELTIPVIANGDIGDGVRAQQVLAHTGCDGLMIGRAALGNPWIFAEVHAYLRGLAYQPPTFATRVQQMRAHVVALHQRYGDVLGVRVARKHVGWYCAHLPGGLELRRAFNLTATAGGQLTRIDAYCAHHDRAWAA